MIESEFEYKKYLREVRGLVEGTCNSYPTYLAAITNHLRIDISLATITDSDSVKEILDRLKSTGIDKNYWGNCQSALRAYLAYLSHESSSLFTSPDELNEFTEGKCIQVQVNRYERDSKARNECIKHHKAVCKVCDLDFSVKYGDIGRGFIHVHHIKLISEIGKSYNVDPINDLVPVCPNCHAMLHSKKPPFTVVELQKLINV